MSKLLILALSAALVACSGGDCEETETSTTPVVTPTVEAQPVVTVEVDNNSTTPADGTKIFVCPQNNITCETPTYKPRPYPPVVIKPICVRDSTPLVLVNGVLTDNCGNKYGSVN